MMPCWLSTNRAPPVVLDTAGYNHLDVAEYLLEHGADVNAQDKGGLIPLHNASSYGVSSTARNPQKRQSRPGDFMHKMYYGLPPRGVSLVAHCVGWKDTYYGHYVSKVDTRCKVPF